MRIDRLDLTAFGCFTARSIDLSAPGVHVVAGPNEAGKSTARHAVGQLLYGIDHRSAYAFVHAMPRMRLGALLRDAHNAAIEIVRHKRNNNALTTPDGTPIPDNEMTRVLADVGSEEFHRVFALDHGELRRGGRDLLAGKGDIGRALFESRSSSRLAEVQEALLEKSGELWRPNGKRRINTAFKELGDLRRAVRELELAPRDFAVAEKAVTRAEEEYARLESDLREVRARQARLTRVRAALPQLLRRAGLVDDIAAESASGPVVADETVAELGRVTTRLAKARDDTAHDRAELAEAQAELAVLDVDTVHLDHAEALEALHAEVSAVRDAAAQLTDADEELWELRRVARERLDTVRPGRSVDDADAYALGPGLADRIAALRNELTVSETALAGAREHVERRTAKLETARTALAEAPSAGDAEALRALLRAVPENLVSEVARHEQRFAELAAKATALRTRHGLDDVPDELVVRLPLPARDQTDEHRAALDTLRTERDAVATRRQTTADQLDGAERELTTLLRGDAPPTEDELRSARGDRDALWAELRSSEDQDADVVAAFERAVTRADELADRIRRQASESLRRVQLEVAVERDRARLTGLDDETAALTRREEDLATVWQALWHAWTQAGAPLLPPAGAGRFIDAAGELTGLLEEAGSARRALEDLRAVESELVARFRTELEKSGEPTAATGLRELTGLADLRVDAVTDALRERGTAEANEHAAVAELAEAQGDLARAESTRAEWEKAWADVVRAVGLDTRDPEALASAVDTLTEVGRSAREIADATRRRDESAARVTDFDVRLAALLSAGWDTEPSPDEGRFAQLAEHHAALGRARQARDTHTLLDTRAGRLTRRIENGDAVLAAASGELAVLVGSAGVPDEAALRDAVARTVRLRELQGELATAEGLLLDSGMPIAELERLAEGWTPSELDAELQQLATDVGHAEAAYTAQGTELGRVRQVLDAIDGSARAAQAQEAASAQAAELAADVEQYVRLEVAREILLRSIESYRRDNQDPVLARAKQLFTTLTGGRFVDLVTGTDAKKGGGILKALRAGAAEDDEAVAVEAMSEGTRDQLYLALRLATLERYADADRTMPLILDDIAMTFDDGRSTALLAVLDSMADSFQIVLFTHHAHLGELARSTLPPGRAHIHELPVFAAGGPA